MKEVEKMYISDCLDKIEMKTGVRPKKRNGGYVARCPAHDDQNPSLSISEGNDGRVLLHCFAGCTIDKICKACDLNISDLFSKSSEEASRIEYSYKDAQGNILFKKIRLEPGVNGMDKSFFWERLDDKGNSVKNLKGCQKVLYRLPELLNGISANKIIFLVEGEKDAESLINRGLIGTTTGESLFWSKSFTEILHDADVTILYDNDKTGIQRRDLLCKELYGKVKRLRVVDLPGLKYQEFHGQDVTDWLARGHTIDDLLKIVNNTPNFLPKNEKAIRVISLNDFLQLQFPERENILSPFLPEQGLCMIYAKRGIGKTHIALGIAYAVAIGGSFLKWFALKPRKVLYIDGEMPASVMQERLKKLSLMYDTPLPDSEYFRLITPDLQDDCLPDLSTKAGQAMVEEAMGDSELLILDNISSLFRSIEENDADSWQEIQEWLLRLRRKGKSVLLVHHAGKSGSQRGSSKKEDILDVVIVLKHSQNYQQSQGASFDIIFEKTRHFTGADAEAFHVELKELADGQLIWEISGSRVSKEVVIVANAAKENLSIKEIMEKTGFTKSQVETRKKKAQGMGLI